MSWKQIILLIILTLIVFLIQQSLLIIFWPINLLLLVVIWLSCWQKQSSLLVALIAGFLLDIHSTIIGPAIISFILVNLLIISLSRHISLEGFNHFLLISFIGILVFFISHYFFSFLFSQWLMNKNLSQLLRISWWQFIEIIFGYQIILIIGYLIKPKEKF